MTKPTITIFLTALIVVISPFKVLSQDDSSSTKAWVLFFGYDLIQDKSYDPSYHFIASNPNTWGHFEMDASSTPSFGLTRSWKKNIRQLPIRWNHTLGFQHTRQAYSGSLGVEEIIDQNGMVIGFVVLTSESKVTKFYLFYRNECKVTLWKGLFIGPMFQADVRVYEHLGSNLTALEDFGVLDLTGKKPSLSHHPRLNLKLGGEMGYTISNHVQLGFYALYGINRSITVEPDHRWRNNQGGFFVNYKLGG